MPWTVGTSGWNYAEWKGPFFPEGLSPYDQLPYYARTFSAVEVNASFYHFMRESVYAKWHDRTPSGFRFCVKVHRLFTHLRRLRFGREEAASLRRFLASLESLKGKLSALLVQLPPGFGKDLGRLGGLLERLEGFRTAVEVRHDSWWAPETYALLERHGAAMVVTQASRWGTRAVKTAPFGYARFHGPRELFASPYSAKELSREARTLRGLGCRTGFAFFNNTAQGFALRNARALKAQAGFR